MTRTAINFCLPTRAPDSASKKFGGEGTTRLATLRDERNSSNAWDLSKNYWLGTLFAIHGRPFPWGPMICYSAYVTAIVCLIVLLLDDYSSSAKLKALLVPVQTIGLALFLLISFRTQTAYDRWWEGRKSWGTITGNCMDLARLVETHCADGKLATKMITWVSVYAIAVKQFLHYSRDMSEVAEMLPLGDLRALQAAENVPLHALTQASHTLQAIMKASASEKSYHVGSIFVEADKRLNRIAAEQMVCARIRNTPMPAGYVIHLRAFLVTWLLLVPFAFVAGLGFVAIPISLVIGYELLGYEEVGVDIENPFTASYHALPLDGLIGTIIANANHFLGCVYARDKDGTDLGAEAPKSQMPSITGPVSAVRAAHVLDSAAARQKFAAHHQDANRQALYDRLGGQAAVAQAVEIFYQKLTSDPFISHFFAGIGMERLKAKQVKFLTYALGGADDYFGKDPTVSHRRLHNEKGLRVEHFYAVVGHLQATLRELGVAEELIEECTAVLAPMEKTFGCSGQVCNHMPKASAFRVQIPQDLLDSRTADMECPM